MSDFKGVAERQLRHLASEIGYKLEDYEIQRYLDELGPINLATLKDVIDEIEAGYTFPSLHAFITRYRQLNQCVVNW